MGTISPATGADALAESHCSDQLSVSTQEIVADVIAARDAHQLARSFGHDQCRQRMG
jgi:hypothetical protein